MPTLLPHVHALTPTQFRPELRELRTSHGPHSGLNPEFCEDSGRQQRLHLRLGFAICLEANTAMRGGHRIYNNRTPYNIRLARRSRVAV